MALSGSYDWTQTADDICTRALVKVGVVAEGQTPTADALSDARKQLNAVIKELEHIGPRLWHTERDSFTTVSGTASYTLDPETAGIEYAFVRDNSYDYHLHLINRFQEAEITDKITASFPKEARFTRQHASKTLTLYPVPDGIYTIYFGKVKTLQDFDSATNNPDLWTSWINALIYLLAADLADDYHLPLEERNRLDMKAQTKLRIAMRKDAEPQDELVVRGSYTKATPSRQRIRRDIFSLTLLMCLVVSCVFGLAQQMDFLAGGVTDSNGVPLSLGTVAFYGAGHIGDASFYKTTWADANKAATNTNPITLSVGGRISAFAEGTYDIRVKDSDGATVFTILSATYGPDTNFLVRGPYIFEAFVFPTTQTNPTILLAQNYTMGQGKIKVYANGIREHFITEVSSNSYQLSGTYLAGWEVLSEVNRGEGQTIRELDTIALASSGATITLSTSYSPGSGQMSSYIQGVRQHQIIELTATTYFIPGPVSAGWEVLSEITP